ncbi:type II CAAX endopeptidase family protein [Haladaptatus sp. F3-133]|jgi:membrane protease YdiL (CAAX protease family)|uniref:Type II CAAX endopeptidase family protein n=1 Tax=Halorutilus salinus TaxID=2487751 RepID=A0A9Q4C5S0_9EURY|nr:type II CAAX endopeptidase family protein [Halorutilus salinus]MCX2819776.1 type II CAAX endopeptidase family protein [Halorutilus salinus]
MGTLNGTASDRPILFFLAVLVAYSTAVATAIYTVLGGVSPRLRVAMYAWGPMVGAGVTVWMSDESLRNWLGQLRNLRVGVRWYLVGVGIMVIGTEFENIVALILGGDMSAPAAPPATYLFLFGFTLFFAGALEELGWRGFLQPRLQRRFSALSASIGIGLLWGLWHVPMILAGLGNFTNFGEYMVNIVAVSIIFGWLYNSTKAALPVVMITHASHNMPPVATGDVPAVFDFVSGDTVLYVSCAAIIVLYAGAQTLTQDRTPPDIPG